MTILTFSISSL